MTTRREFLYAAAAMAAVRAPSAAGYDLLMKGGRVARSVRRLDRIS